MPRKTAFFYFYGEISGLGKVRLSLPIRDLILVMGLQHLQRSVALHPEAVEKSLLLGMADAANNIGEITDPYGKTPDVYEHILDQIVQCTTHTARMCLSTGDN